MEDASAWEVAMLFAVVTVATVVPILVWSGRVRKRWRDAAATTGLPLTGKTAIAARVPGGEVVAGEEFRTVYTGPSSDLPDQVVTSILGILAIPPPEYFVASTDGADFGGPPFTTGDPAFDAVVVVGAEDAEAGRAYLTPRRREGLLRFFASLPRGKVSSGRIGFIRDGRMYTPELTRTLAAVKQALADLGEE